MSVGKTSNGKVKVGRVSDGRMRQWMTLCKLGAETELASQVSCCGDVVEHCRAGCKQGKLEGKMVWRFVNSAEETVCHHVRVCLIAAIASFVVT